MEAEQRAGEPIRVVHASEIVLHTLEPPTRPRMRLPYADAIVLDVMSNVRIQTDEVEDGGWPPFSEHEGIRVGVSTAGVGGGEWWHRHLSFHNVVLYVTAGEGTIYWKTSEGERSETLTSGDFVFIAPGTEHRWTNGGEDDFTFVWFAHCHDARRGR